MLDEKIAQANDPDEKARLNALKGKIAVANAKLAYQRYKRLFAGARWQALAAKGAKTQRLLWASTGTKNKAYSDVLYVDELIGPDTINTMPIATMDAFRDHGKLADTLDDNVADAQRVLGDLGRAGISLDAVTDKLVEDGVRLFADAADKLFAAVAEKRGKILDGKIDTQTLALGDALTKKVDATAEEWRSHGSVRRLWQRDKSLWTGTDEDRWLGWLDTVEADQIKSYQAFAEEIRREGFADALLLGMGGSSLGPEVLATVFGHKSGFPRLRILDSTVPAQIKAIEARSISARHCSSCRASQAPRPSRIFSRIIFSSVSLTPSAKRKPAGNLSPSPIPAPRWSKRPRRRIFARYFSACPASADVTPCCRRSVLCRRRSPASTSRRWKSRRA